MLQLRLGMRLARLAPGLLKPSRSPRRSALAAAGSPVIEAGRFFRQIEPCVHRALSIVLMDFGISKHRQYFISRAPGHFSPHARDHIRASIIESAYGVGQVLGIEVSGKR